MTQMNAMRAGVDRLLRQCNACFLSGCFVLISKTTTDFTCLPTDDSKPLYCRFQAEAVQMNANAQATAIEMVSAALRKPNGNDAAALNVAEQYVRAFGNMAKQSNTVIVPSDVANASSMIAQALNIYNQLTANKLTAL